MFGDYLRGRASPRFAGTPLRLDVFSSTPFGGNQLAILLDATGISTEGMQKIAREFNFPESTFVLPKNDPANSYRVRIFTPRAELNFAGHPTIGTACALVMKHHAQTVDPIRLILEGNIGPVMVDVGQRKGGYHGTLTLSGKIDAPTGAPAPADLAAALSIEPAEVSQSFFAGVGLPFCFAQLKSNEAVDRAAVNRAAWTATLSRAWSPNSFSSLEIYGTAATCMLACAHPRWASKRIPRRAAPVPPWPHGATGCSSPKIQLP